MHQSKRMCADIAVVVKAEWKRHKPPTQVQWVAKPQLIVFFKDLDTSAKTLQQNATEHAQPHPNFDNFSKIESCYNKQQGVFSALTYFNQFFSELFLLVYSTYLFHNQFFSELFSVYCLLASLVLIATLLLAAIMLTASLPPASQPTPVVASASNMVVHPSTSTQGYQRYVGFFTTFNVTPYPLTEPPALHI